MERVAQNGGIWPSEQRFTGTNVTSGGSVFQGSIRTENGAVNINLAGNIRDQRRIDVLAWLSNVKYIRHHKFAKSKRLRGTGEWLLQRNEYQLWANAAGSAIFWLYGIPGAGKTELASLIIDIVTEDLQSTTETALLYFYCASDEDDRSNSACLMRTLIHQLLCISPSSFEIVDKIYEKNRIAGFCHGVLDYADSMELLAEIVPELQKTVIVIDALDECDMSSRTDILEAFERLSSLSEGIVKIFVTSRYSDDIALALDDHLKLHIKTQDIYDDISLFVDHELCLAIRRKKLLRGKVEHELQQRLKSTLTQRANGMFLWARLQITHLCDAATKASLLLALEELPSDLKETYDRIWARVQQQHRSRKELAEQTLALLLYSLQPLSANAIAEAVTSDDPTYGDDEAVVDVALILDSCQSLVVLDSELGILRPIHFTAHAFLKDHISECVSHSQIAVNCLRRISNVATLIEVSNKSFHRNNTIANFAVYAILNWPVHISQGDRDGKVDFLEQRFLADQTLQHWWIINLRIHAEHSTKKLSLLLDILKAYRESPDASLIAACFFGLRYVESAIHSRPYQRHTHHHPVSAEYVSWRPTKKYLVDGMEELGLVLGDWRIAGILCASDQGHASIVDQFLKRIPKADKAWRKTYPSDVTYVLGCCSMLAVANGHVSIVEAFLKVEYNIVFDTGGYYPYSNLDGGTLALAAFRGQGKKIEFLLKTSHLSVITRDRILVQALRNTARWQNEKAFALLLSHANDDIDLTPALLSAASSNNGKVIELILETSAPSLKARSIDGRSERALIKAAWGDCGAAAKILCQDDKLDFRSCDRSGMNALQISVLECHTDFLESILERNDLDVNVRGRWGETPLILAVRKGHTAVVRLLLNSGKADTSLRDTAGLTAMDIAVLKDHQPIINLLSHSCASSEDHRLQEDGNEAEHSPLIAQPIARWFQ